MRTLHTFHSTQYYLVNLPPFITAPIRFANGTLNLIQLEIYIIRFYSTFHLDFNKIKYFSKSVDLRLRSFKRKKVSSNLHADLKLGFTCSKAKTSTTIFQLGPKCPRKKMLKSTLLSLEGLKV